ncbi:hypothetical protein [Oceanisphaera sp. W20_SRM_FM3]|uniref:hypothetical protein n=1 Tax=Oceanisphaera sp. W20_SRM_FM3 TaxID=3240267 RepID=UPI003F9BAF0A
MKTSKRMTLSSALLAFTLTGCDHSPTADEQVAAAIAKFTEQADIDYQHGFFDLNSDGVEDALVLLTGSDWCGSGGCTLLVLEGKVLSPPNMLPSFNVISQSTVTRTPVGVADSKSQRWHDVIVHSGGEEKILQSDGQHYPHNASMQPAATAEQLNGAKIVLP